MCYPGSMSNTLNGAVSVGTSVTEIIPQRPGVTERRVKLYANYAAGGNVVNLGGETVTASDGVVFEGVTVMDFELKPGESIHGIASGGSLEVRYIEHAT